jgi:hypothetical protein
MAIPEPLRANFNTMLRAAASGHLALLECLDAKTRNPRYVIVAINRSGDECEFVPFGHLVSDQNPYDAYLPPDPENDEGFIEPATA